MQVQQFCLNVLCICFIAKSEIKACFISKNESPIVFLIAVVYVVSCQLVMA